MDELNKVVQAMALARFKHETNTPERMQDYFLKYATLGEFRSYLNRVDKRYDELIIGKMDGLMETFLCEVVYKRRKEIYIEELVQELESKVETKYKITIEQVQ